MQNPASGKEDAGNSPRRWTGSSLRTAAAWLAAGLAVVMLAGAFSQLPTDEAVWKIRAFLERLGWWAPIAFFVAYIVLALVLFPTWILGVAAGAAFGLAGGVAIVSLSSTSAAAVAFLIARYGLRERLRRRIERSPKLTAIDRALGREGWKIVALLRLSPVAPFTVQNYLYGVSAIRFWTCIGVSWLTMLPGTFLYVYLGWLGRGALEESARAPTAAEWALRLVGLAATIAVTWYTARLARRAIRQAHLDVTLQDADDSRESN